MEWLTQRFELSRGGGAHNVRPMEGLRGFAVFLVFLVHYVTLVKPWVATNSSLQVLAGKIHTIGNAGVDLFFVLSGFLIYGTLISKQQAFGRFMWRRVVRIYPAFTAVFVAYIVLSFVFPSESKIPAPALQRAVYLIQNFLLLPGLFAIEPLITVAWSLSYEMFYYLVIPLAISLLGLRHRSAVWRVGFFALLATFTAVACAYLGGPVRLTMFVSGILLYEAIQSGRVPAPNSGIGLLALILGLAGTLLPVSGTVGAALKIGILFVSFFVLCMACFQDAAAGLPRVFSWTPMRWLGNMSYSYYLLHGLALKAGFMALSVVLPPAAYGAWMFWALLPIMFMLTLFPTAALFLAVERPFSLAAGRSKGAIGQLALNQPGHDQVPMRFADRRD